MQKQLSGEYLNDISNSTKIQEFSAQKYARDTNATIEFLKHNTTTATAVAVALGIYRPNVCRIKRDLEIAGVLREVKKGCCPITRHRAAFLSTNPDLISKLKGGEHESE